MATTRSPVGAYYETINTSWMVSQRAVAAAVTGGAGQTIERWSGTQVGMMRAGLGEHACASSSSPAPGIDDSALDVTVFPYAPTEANVFDDDAALLAAYQLGHEVR